MVNNCNRKHQLITQDLLICELDVFYENTILELGHKAHAHNFFSLVPVQQLLTDIWYDKINWHIPGWKVSFLLNKI